MVICRRGWPDQPGLPPRASPRGPTGAACSTASPPPWSLMPSATTATSSSCNLVGTGQNLCYTPFDFTRRGSSLCRSWTSTASLHCVVSHAAHLWPRMSLFSPETKLPPLFLRSCLFHKFGNITLLKSGQSPRTADSVKSVNSQVFDANILLSNLSSRQTSWSGVVSRGFLVLAPRRLRRD